MDLQQSSRQLIHEDGLINKLKKKTTKKHDVLENVVSKPEYMLLIKYALMVLINTCHCMKLFRYYYYKGFGKRSVKVL